MRLNKLAVAERVLPVATALLLIATSATGGCDSETAVEIRGVSPTVVTPGAQAVVVGHGFCGDFSPLASGNCLPPATLAIGGRIVFTPNDVIDYFDDEIRFVLPSTAASGSSLLSLTVEGFGTDSVPFEIGEQPVESQAAARHELGEHR